MEATEQKEEEAAILDETSNLNKLQDQVEAHIKLDHGHGPTPQHEKTKCSSQEMKQPGKLAATLRQ